jgi:hypothetical protein
MVTCAYCKAEMMLPESIWAQLHPAPQRVVSPVNVVIGAPRGTLLVGLIVAAVSVLGVGIAVAVAVIGATSGKVTPIPTLTAANPIAAVGEACNGRRAACSKDGAADLVCASDGKMAVAQTCKGPGACRAAPDGKSISCDATLGDANDPCDIEDDACSTDHKSELRCQAGRFAVLASCKGPDGCTLTPASKGKGYTLSCDDHVADVGDPCFDADRTACSSDKKSLLTCTAQRFVVHHACRRGCRVKKLVGTGNTELDCE